MQDSRNDLIRAMTAATRSGYGEARAMPGDFYLSAEMLALEKQELFAREWTCIGREEEIPSPGDYMTYDILNEPVVAVRGEDGEIRALSNVCRHRAMPLVDGTGRAKRIVCPYHAWTYDTTGQLIGAPYLNEHASFDKRKCRLPQFACEVWQGFVFVNLDPDAQPLAPRLHAAEDMMRPYHFEDMRIRYRTDEVWHANWKLVVENFMEGYHLSTLHRDSLALINPTNLCEHFPPGDDYFGYTVGFAPHEYRREVGHPDLSLEQINTCVMVAVMPNLLIGGGSDVSSFLCIEPIDEESTRVRLNLLFYGDDWEQKNVDFSVELFQQTMAEDKTVLDHLARGLRSAHYTPGPLAPAPYEGCVLDLHRYVSKRLLPTLQPPGGKLAAAQ